MSRARHDVARRIELVIFDERFADRFAHRLEEGVRHRAADEQSVDARDQVFDDLDLVRDLGAAENGDERPLGIADRGAEVAQLLLHEQPGTRFRHQTDDRLDGCVCAMRRAERVVDINVAQGREPLREFEVVLFFLRVEAEVLEQHDTTGWRVAHGAFSGGADDSPPRRRRRDLAARQYAWPPGAGSCPDSAFPSGAQGVTPG